jgi:hypothetical protein
MSLCNKCNLNYRHGRTTTCDFMKHIYLVIETGENLVGGLTNCSAKTALLLLNTHKHVITQNLTTKGI